MVISRRHIRSASWWLSGFAVLAAAAPAAALDLAAARSWQLDNGLTLIVLEDHTLPLASVQMLYKVGARNEDNGRTGLAHFLEHMAYRATKNFPATNAVGAIYAAGGEWHGYTWVDQTTYFETVPRSELDLALRIEADRMANLVIAPEEVGVERSAVLAELHSYDNDLASVLHDTVLMAAFLQHPYRNNTIGWESDVGALGHDDLVDFYQRHYRPANGVLAVVGDLSADAVHARVVELFSGMAAAPATPPVPTVEPAQRGERRVLLDGAGDRNLFEIAYVAPAVRDADYGAFLLLQEILAGGTGVNFAQTDGASPAREDSLLAVAAAGVSSLQTWFPPAEFPYLYTISGSMPRGAEPADTEAAIERAVAALRDREVTPATLAAAQARVLEELVFDVETTKDAAHELAFFAGLNALDERLRLRENVAAVTAADVQRVAQRYLQPWQRTIGWYREGAAPDMPARAATTAPVRASAAAYPGQSGPKKTPAPSEPVVKQLASGLTVIVQRVPLSPAIFVGALVPGMRWDLPAELMTQSPVWGYSTVALRSLPGDLRPALDKLRAALEHATPLPEAGDEPDGTEAALVVAMEKALGVVAPEPVAPARPALVTVVGDLGPRSAITLLQKTFGNVRPAAALPGPATLAAASGDVQVGFPGPAIQAQLGYAVPAPAPRERQALAWQLALYVLSHDYEGRLGIEAIRDRGLVYYIDGRYDSDGSRAWISLAAGVDPAKLPAMDSLLREELQRLRESPPTAAELAEARRHMLGREQTAAQSNEEIAAELARQWLWHGRLRRPGELASELAAVTDEDVRNILPAFTAGTIVTVEVPE